MSETPSYEEARDELVAVVQKLEAGGTSLQESIALWERGEELAAICQRWLDGARARLDAVMNPAEHADKPAPAESSKHRAAHPAPDARDTTDSQ